MTVSLYDTVKPTLDFYFCDNPECGKRCKDELGFLPKPKLEPSEVVVLDNGKDLISVYCNDCYKDMWNQIK